MWPAYKGEGGGKFNSSEVLGEREVRSLGSGRECLRGHYCFFLFFFLRPPDEHKNSDWSELIRST